MVYTMASFEQEGEEVKWIVTEETSPSPWGCHSGKEMSDLDVLALTDVRVHGPFATKSEALKTAKSMLHSDCRFEDFESIDPEMFQDGPPYNSSMLENFDEDYWVNIDVVTMKDHEVSMAEKKEEWDKKVEEKQKAEEERMKKAKDKFAKQARKVFYAFTRRDDDDVKAEQEIRLSYPNNDYTAEPIMEPPLVEFQGNAHNVKTLMIKDCYNWSAQQAGSKDVVVETILRMFTSLEELHWHDARLVVSNGRLKNVLDSNPQLLNLRVLSIPFATTTSDGLYDICYLTKLERLDLRCALSLDPSCDFGYDTESDDECEGEYFGVITDIVICSIKTLKSLNLGTVDDESQTMMFQYSIKPREIDNIKYNSGLLNENSGIKISLNTFYEGDTLGADSDSDDDDEDQQPLGFEENDDSDECFDSGEGGIDLDRFRLCIMQACEDRGVKFLDVAKKYREGNDEAAAFISELMMSIYLPILEKNEEGR